MGNYTVKQTRERVPMQQDFKKKAWIPKSQKPIARGGVQFHVVLIAVFIYIYFRKVSHDCLSSALRARSHASVYDIVSVHTSPNPCTKKKRNIFKRQAQTHTFSRFWRSFRKPVLSFVQTKRQASVFCYLQYGERVLKSSFSAIGNDVYL